MFSDADLVTVMPQLQKFALRLTRNATDAEDLTSEVIVRMLEKRNMFVDGSLFSWGSKIMFNMFASKYRRARKFDSQFDPEPYIAAVKVEAGIDENLDARAALRVLAQLHEYHRGVLERVSIGQSYDEIAAALNIPLGTVRSRVSRARDQFLIKFHDPKHQSKGYGRRPPGANRRPRTHLRRAFAMAAFVPFTTADGQLRAQYAVKAINEFHQGENI